MKLKRDKWEVVQLKDVVIDMKDGGTPSRAKSEYFGGEIKWCVVKDIKPEIFDTSEKLTELGLKKCSSKLWPVNSIIISLGATVGEVGIARTPVATKQGLSGIVVNLEKTFPEFLYIILNKNKEYIKSLATGTTIKEVRPTRLQEYLKLYLPPLSEQKQIAALFQSIETAMEEVDGQERRLKAMQKSLVNGLMGKEPVFGNILTNKNCTATTFGGIAECDKKYPEHEKEVERYVGLEWIEADNFHLQGYGLVSNGTTFTKRFTKGDVLFGKRRPYLKKVAVADFDGICSGDILVIKAKANKMLQGLLPYYISSEVFIQHAVSTSAGSLSPRTKWKDLAELEVSIPDVKTQERILEVLHQFDTTITQLKQQKATLKLLKQKLLNEILG